MQAAILDFPSRDVMPITEGRFTKLEGRVDDILDRLAKVEGASGVSKHHWTVWLPVGAPVVALFAVAVTVGIHLDSKISTLQRDVQSFSGRLGKVEDAVKVLGNQQSDQTQKLIHDLLSSAGNANNPAVAGKAIRAAASLIATLRKEKRPASFEFFKTSIEALDQVTPEATQAAFVSKVALAQYRSTLESVPDWGTKFVVDVPMEHAVKMLGPDSGITGVEYDAQKLTGDVIVLGPVLRGRMSENVIFDNDKIVGASQMLDGIHWRNTIFVGTHIRYNGGEVELTNVRFINCTFEFPNNERGRRLVNYAALLPTSSLKIG